MDTLLTELQKASTLAVELLQGTFKRMPQMFRTIRFKLAFMFSSILFLFASALILAFNLYIGQSLRRDKEIQAFRFSPIYEELPGFVPNFEQLKVDEKQRIRDIRLNDLRRIQSTSMVALLPLAFVSFGIGYYFSGKFLDPLSRLRRNIEKLQTKDLGVALLKDEDDEVGALVNSFNDLSSRLRDAFNSQEQFVQNASHELRTPLAVIQTNLDTALDDPQISTKDLKSAVQQALQGVKQLNKLVNYLLELTSVSRQAFTTINLESVVAEQVSGLKQLAEDQKLTLLFVNHAPSKSFVYGDQVLLARVVQNLLENAIKYSAPINGEAIPITVTLSSKNTNIELSVQNGSRSIPPEKLSKLFDRFYQVEPSRSKKSGGYGLGLAIAKKIVDDHGGSITAKNEKNATVLTVSLPLMP